MLPIWNGLGEKHKRFHNYGAGVINALNSGDYMQAQQICQEAENYSQELISDLEKMRQIAANA